MIVRMAVLDYREQRAKGHKVSNLRKTGTGKAGLVTCYMPLFVYNFLARSYAYSESQ